MNLGVNPQQMILDRMGGLADRLEHALHECSPLLLPSATNETEVRRALQLEENSPAWGAFRILLMLEPLLKFVEDEIIPVVTGATEEELREHVRRRDAGGRFTKRKH